MSQNNLRSAIIKTTMPQLQLTPTQQSQLLAELYGADAPEALRAAIAAGAPEVTPALLALLREVAETPLDLALDDRAAWQALYRRASALVVLNG